MLSVSRVFPRLGIALAALVIALMAFMVYQADNTRMSSARRVAHTQAVLAKLGDMNEGISRLGVAQLLFLLSGNDTFVQQRDQVLRRTQADIADIEHLTADNPAQQRRIRDIRERLLVRYRYMQNTERQRRQEGLNGKLYQTFLSAGKQQTEAIQLLGAAMKRDEQQLLDERSAKTVRLYSNQLDTLLAISFCGAMIILIGLVYSRRWIVL